MNETEFKENQEWAIEILKGLPFLSALPQKHLEGIFRVSLLRDYEEEEVLFTEGDSNADIYLLLAGEVKIVKHEAVLARLHHTGDVFGELSILSGTPRSATVQAVTHTSCLVISEAFLHKLAPSDRAIVYAVIYKSLAEVVSSRLRETTGEMVRLKTEIGELQTAATGSEPGPASAGSISARPTTPSDASSSS